PASEPSSSLSLRLPADLPPANEPMVLALDSVVAGDEAIHYVLACNGECLLKINSETRTCKDVCRGSYSGNGDVVFNATAGNSSLALVVPRGATRHAIVVAFNSPNLPSCNNTYLQPCGHAEYDYGSYNWVLTGLRGVTDAFGNEIDKWVVSTETGLSKEGMLGRVLVDADGGLVQLGDVLNPGFEEKLYAWVVKNGEWYATTDAFQGKYSLFMSSDSDDKNYYVEQAIPVLPGKVYTVSGWIKTRDVVGKGAYLTIKVVDDEGNKVLSTNIARVTGTNNWTRYEKQIATKNGTTMFIYLKLYKATGDAWFDNIFVNTSNANSVLWFNNLSTSFNGIAIEPEPELEYGSVDADTSGIIIGEPFYVSQPLRIRYNGVRPVVIALAPNATDFQNCELEEGEDCFESHIVEGSETMHFSYEVPGVVYEYGSIKQAPGSTDERQFLIQSVTITNTNPELNFTDIEGAVYVLGVCSNYDESKQRIHWGDKYTREHACYVHLDKLGAGESVTKEVEFFGDFVDVSYGEIEQDMSRQSTLEEQYFRRAVKLIPKGNLDMNWQLEVEVPFWNETIATNVSIVKPVLDLEFDECNGTVVHDSSGNHNDGIIHGNATWIRTDDGGCALEFDGIDDWVELPHNTILDLHETGTLIIWVNIKNYSNDYFSIIQKGTKDGWRSGSYAIWYHKVNKVLMGVIHDGKEYDSVNLGKPKPKEWHSIALVWDGGELTSYVNGKLSDVSKQTISPLVNSKPIWIGKSVSGWFDGKISRVEIYDKPLTKTQIHLLLNNSNAFSEVGLGHYNSALLRFNLSTPNLKQNNSDQTLELYQRLTIENPYNITLSQIRVNHTLNIKGSLIHCTVNGSKWLVNSSVSNKTTSFLVPLIQPQTKQNYTIHCKIKNELKVKINLKYTPREISLKESNLNSNK
ncbi:hypothetical protein DRJ48_05390, partial [Candidatus Woesearchaeota archaeon]